jgi:pyrroloquinoline quinone biosynthesis protein D
MPPPLNASQPKFASGCRWGTNGEEQVVLFPEGMIRVQGTGQLILELCDGERTIDQIVSELSNQFNNADSDKIRQDVHAFLESLNEKRIVDY